MGSYSNISIIADHIEWQRNELVSLILSLRRVYKNAANYEMSDQIRENLKTLGIQILDKKDGTSREIYHSGYGYYKLRSTQFKDLH